MILNKINHSRGQVSNVKVLNITQILQQLHGGYPVNHNQAVQLDLPEKSTLIKFLMTIFRILEGLPRSILEPLCATEISIQR